MISAYAVIPLVFGLVLSYLGLIHRFWLRDVFREDHKRAVRTRIVILGGGFGGLYSALHFEKTTAADPTVEVKHVTLHGIDRVSRLLAYVRQHPVIPPAVASDSTSALRSSPQAKRTAILEL